MSVPVSVEEALPAAVQRIAEALQPEKIVLFGSYAYGTPTPDSDVDLRVIMETSQSPRERFLAVCRLLHPRPKAVLVAKGQPFPKIHDLLLPNDLCTQAGVFLMVSPDLLADLSRQAVHARYPGEDPTPDEAKEALEIAKSVRRFVRKSLAIKGP